MKIVNGYKLFEASTKPIVITIGNFDGVHVGHRSVFKKLTDKAYKINGIPVVMTFDPHPMAVLAPTKKLEFISTKESKLRLFEEAGIQITIIEEFTEEFANVNAREFFEKILIEGLNVKEIFIGYDFTFGKNKEGTPDSMKRYGDEFKIPVTVIPPFKINNEIVSATLVRKALLSGDLEKSRKLLGYPYELCGKVVKGAGRGKGLGYPTANICPGNQIIPQKGIYVTEVVLDGKKLPSVTSIGLRPTFKEENPPLVIESLIFNFNKDVYGKVVALRFLKRIRDEERFSSIAELKRAIAKDVEIAKTYFSKR